ncbi:hypothetical protein PAN31117_04242 [Pandoraea anapnoica]|uniref:Uncharacterized protein n=1 Tax=Pandoraea anapnoica TaxID=2508301 RepID=A0A5E5AHH7_9BURK|nr:hypothetical protein PAN31117_04242 [Pandoraea anapnoica]
MKRGICRYAAKNVSGMNEDAPRGGEGKFVTRLTAI